MQGRLGALRRSQPPGFSGEADRPFRSSSSGPTAAAATPAAGSAGACPGSAAVGFESGVSQEEEFDEV